MKIKLKKQQKSLKAPCTRLSPCENGGSCSNTLTSPNYWSCDCSSTYGFSGTNCELRKYIFC